LTITNYSLATKSGDRYHVTDGAYQKTKYVDYSGFEPKKYIIHDYTMTNFGDVVFLNLSRSGIPLALLVDITSLSMTQTLDLSYNYIKEFDGARLKHLKLNNLNFLNLSHNKDLHFVDALNYRYLQILDLSYTNLTYLGYSTINEVMNLRYLD
jgi:Leucine-rich repeat (LRR) protein